MRLGDVRRSTAVLLVSPQAADASRLTEAADRLAALLTSPDGWALPSARCRRLGDGDLREAVAEFDRLAAQATDTLVVCYLGQAMTQDGELYLPLDGMNSSDLPGTTLPFADLAAAVEGSGARTKLVLLAQVPALWPGSRRIAGAQVVTTAAFAPDVAEALERIVRDDRTDEFRPEALRSALNDALPEGVTWDDGGSATAWGAGRARGTREPRSFGAPPLAWDDEPGGGTVGPADRVWSRVDGGGPAHLPGVDAHEQDGGAAGPPAGGQGTAGDSGGASPRSGGGREAARPGPRWGRPHRGVRRSSGRRWPRPRRWLPVAATLAVAALVAGVLTLHGGPGHRPAADCDLPLVVNVLAAPDVVPVVSAQARRFEERNLTGDGCPKYRMAVYSAPGGNVVQAFVQHWAPLPTDLTAQQFQPARDIGPMPVIWIPGSSAEAYLAGGRPARSASATPTQPSGQDMSIEVGDALAWTRLVVAVPQRVAGVLAASHRDGANWTWAELYPALQRAHVDLVRPNPTSSSVGMLHTMALYAARRAAGADLHQVEAAIDSRVSQDGYPAGDDGDLLCHYATRVASGGGAAGGDVALLVSEQALADYGSAGGCGASAPQAGLVGIPVDGVPALDHPFVTVHWPGARQREWSAVARAFDGWLRGGGAQQALKAAAGRDAAKNPRGGFQVLDSDADLQAADPEQAVTEMRTYAALRVPGRVLIALETSTAMDEADRGFNEGSPLAASTAAIAEATSLLGTDDAVGLWTFSTTGGDLAHDVRERVGLGRLDDEVRGQSRRSLLTATLGGVRSDDTDRNSLYDVIRRAVAAVEHAAPGGPPPVTAVVVITSGRQGTITDPPLTAVTRDLATAVPIYVLAFSAGVCADINATLNRLKVTAGGGGGSCSPTTPGRVAEDLRGRLAGLWKGVR